MSGRTHVLIIVLTLLSIGFMLRLVRGQRLKAKYSLLWLSVGGLLVVVSLVPALFDAIARRLGVDYQPTLYLVLGLAFLLLVVVHVSYELTRMENRIRRLVEEVTFLRHDLDQARGRTHDDSGADPP
jgi:hypothetical protein